MSGLSSRKRIKTSTVVTAGYVFLVVTDLMSGLRDRYTVYAVSFAGMKEARVIGREVTKKGAQDVVDDWLADHTLELVPPKPSARTQKMLRDGERKALKLKRQYTAGKLTKRQYEAGVRGLVESIVKRR